jgi:hypothetical protein
VLSTDPTGCARAGLIAFLSGATVQPCDKATQDKFTLPAAPYAPATLAKLRPTRLPGLRGQTYSALTVTLTGIGFDAASLRGSFKLPGLRAGYVTAKGSRITLHGVSWIEGVLVSGTLDGRHGGTLTVSGPVSGTVTYSSRGATGVLGGVPFNVN